MLRDNLIIGGNSDEDIKTSAEETSKNMNIKHRWMAGGRMGHAEIEDNHKFLFDSIIMAMGFNVTL